MPTSVRTQDQVTRAGEREDHIGERRPQESIRIGKIPNPPVRAIFKIFDGRCEIDVLQRNYPTEPERTSGRDSASIGPAPAQASKGEGEEAGKGVGPPPKARARPACPR